MHKRSIRLAAALAALTLLAGCSAVLGRSSGTKLTLPVLTGLPTAVGTSTASAPAPSGSAQSSAGSAGDLPPVANTAPRKDLPRFRAAKAGTLPATGDDSLDGVSIPPGDPVPTTARAGGAQTLWVSWNPVSNLGPTMLRLIKAFPQTGLWPVAIDSTESDLAGDFDRSGTSTPVTADPKAAFARWWQQNMGTGPGQQLDTFAAADLGTVFPGLQTPPEKFIPDAMYGELVKLKGKLGLVSVTRPADIAAVTGWLGPTNYLDPGEVSVALRSWEDRYAVEPIELGFDYLVMSMANPPNNAISVLDLAAEQMAACPDEIEQGNYDSAVEYANSLTGSNELDCWWD